MAVDWMAIYERDEDRTLEMLRRRAERRKAQASGTSSQDGTTTATTSGTDTDQTAEASPELIPPRQQEPENGK